jgi:hypothetical protein
MFCSGAENDSVVGDLIEQYENGRGRVWYWRQVLAIVVIEIYRRIARRPLMRTAKISPPLGIAVAVVIIVLLSTLLSSLWLFGLGVLLGVIVGGLKFAYDNNLINTEKDIFTLPPIPVNRVITDEPLNVAATNDRHSSKEAPMHLHHGINTTSIASEGFEGLPGLLMMIFFVFAFISLFVPRDNQWFLVLFLVVEAGAAVLFLLASRRNRRDSMQLKKALHEMNTPQQPK